VLRWLFSSSFENGTPPGQPSSGLVCQPAISNAMIVSAPASSEGLRLSLYRRASSIPIQSLSS
jgi:hypothetical protein